MPWTISPWFDFFCRAGIAVGRRLWWRSEDKALGTSDGGAHVTPLNPIYVTISKCAAKGESNAKSTSLGVLISHFLSSHILRTNGWQTKFNLLPNRRVVDGTILPQVASSELP